MEQPDLKEGRGIVRVSMQIGKSTVCMCVCPVGNGISRKVAEKGGQLGGSLAPTVMRSAPCCP